MPSTPPSPGHTPPRYPGHGGRVGRRLGAGAIPAIIAVVILIAAGVTAAVVWTGTSPHPQPPKPGSVTVHPTASSTPGTIQPHAMAPRSIARTPTTALSAAVTLAAATAVDLSGGVSLTPAPGWTIAHQDKNSVTLLNSDSTVEMFATVGKANSTDIKAELANDIKRETTGGGMTNVQLNPGDPPTALQGTNFQKMYGVDYSGDVSTQQGTTALTGTFIELLNPSTGLSAFIDTNSASNDALNKATTDAGKMIASML